MGSAGSSAPKAISALQHVAQNKKEDEEVHIMAVEAIGVMGSEAVPVLETFLQPKQELLLRRWAASSLGRTKSRGDTAIPGSYRCSNG